MPKPDGRIEAGQRIGGAVSARAWNRAQDAADIVLGATTGTFSAAGPAAKTPYTWVYCQSSVTVARWGVLAITGMAITPTGAEGGATASFEEMPTITGGTPSATTTAWCVAVEPIASGKVGRVAVGGVVQLRYADLNKATGAQVLWKDATWALIRLQSGVVRGTFSGAWAKGAAATVTDAITTSATYSGVKNYLTSITGTGTKDCLIAFVGAEWVLVEFDLLQLDGYSLGKSQVLGTVSGALKWIDTTACT